MANAADSKSHPSHGWVSVARVWCCTYRGSHLRHTPTHRLRPTRACTLGATMATAIRDVFSLALWFKNPPWLRSGAL